MLLPRLLTLVNSPLSPAITTSLFHSRLKTYLFHKYFPPSSLKSDPTDFTTRSFLLSISIFGRPIVKRFVLCHRSVVCLSVMSVLCVTSVYCGQTVGRSKTKLGMQVDLGPGHIVLDGDPAPPPLKGGGAPIFGPFLLWPNCWMDQDATLHGGRSRPRPQCVRWGPSSPSPKGHSLPIFGSYLLCTNGWMDQDDN